jgi:hypothetical protein
MTVNIAALRTGATAVLFAALIAVPGLRAQTPEPELATRLAGSRVYVDFDLRPTNVDDLTDRLNQGSPVSVRWMLNTQVDARMWRNAPGPHAVVRLSARPAADGRGFVVTETVSGIKRSAAFNDGSSLDPTLLRRSAR